MNKDRNNNSLAQLTRSEKLGIPGKAIGVSLYRFGSELFHDQAGCAAKIAHIASCHSIAEFDRARADNQICQWQGYPLRDFFATDPSDNFGCGFRHRVNRNVGVQLVQK
jgi:hypothetical protein